MSDKNPDGITPLLARWRAGQRKALDPLIPAISYDELLPIIHRLMQGERRGYALPPVEKTATVQMIAPAKIKGKGMLAEAWPYPESCGTRS